SVLCGCGVAGARPERHSFPTRRSSDLDEEQVGIVEHEGRAGDLGVSGPDEVVEESATDLMGLHWGPRWVYERNVSVGPSAYRRRDRKSTRLNSSHVSISYAVFCLKHKT